MVKTILQIKEENSELIKSVAQDLNTNITEKAINELAKHERETDKDDSESLSGDS